MLPARKNLYNKYTTADRRRGRWDGRRIQKLKLLYLKELFERQSDEEHLLSMQDILDALAAQGIRAERKSVYDDILCLQQFGMDIVTVKGRNGGYFSCLAHV